MLRRPKPSKNEVVAPKEKQEYWDSSTIIFLPTLKFKKKLINFIIGFWKFWRKNFKNYIWSHNTVKSKVYDNDEDGGGRGVVDGDEEDWWR